MPTPRWPRKQERGTRNEQYRPRFHRTLGCKVGPNLDQLSPVQFRKGSDPLGKAPPLYTGIHKVDFEGNYETDASVCIVQDQPLPLTLCNVLPEMVTHESR